MLLLFGSLLGMTGGVEPPEVLSYKGGGTFPGYGKERTRRKKEDEKPQIVDVVQVTPVAKPKEDKKQRQRDFVEAKQAATFEVMAVLRESLARQSAIQAATAENARLQQEISDEEDELAIALLIAL
jgi:hypothetical protein